MKDKEDEFEKQRKFQQEHAELKENREMEMRRKCFWLHDRWQTLTEMRLQKCKNSWDNTQRTVQGLLLMRSTTHRRDYKLTYLLTPSLTQGREGIKQNLEALSLLLHVLSTLLHLRPPGLSFWVTEDLVNWLTPFFQPNSCYHTAIVLRQISYYVLTFFQTGKPE